MITNTLALLSTLLLTILVVPLLCKKSRIPSIVGFIVVGMLIGPNALDLVAYSQTIDTIGKLGILYILFQAGIELDKNDFLQQRRQALSFGLIALLFPALLGGLGGWALGYTWQTCVLLGALLGSHTLITYPIVSKYNLQKLPAVGIVVGGTLVTVALSLLVLGVMHVKDSWWIWLMKVVFFIVVTVWCFPYALRWCFKRQSDSTVNFLLVMVALVVSAWLADFAGLEGILGAFICGVSLNGLVPQRSTLMSRINFMGNTMFVPIFLLGVGMLIDLRVFFSSSWGLLVAAVMIGTKLIGKQLATLLAWRLWKFTRSERRLVYGLVQASSAGTLAIATIGYQHGVFDVHIFNGAVILILVLCITASFLTEHAARQIVATLPSEQTGDSEPWLLLSIGTKTQAAKAREALTQIVRLSELHEVEMRNITGWQDAEQGINHDGRATIYYSQQQPVNTVRRFLVGVPPNAERENDLLSLFGLLRRLSSQTGARIVFYCTHDTEQAIRAFCSRRGKAMRATYVTVSQWSGMSEALQKDIRHNDLVALISARPGTPSYNPLLSGNYAMLKRNFEPYSHLILYPRQDITSGSNEVFFSF